MESKKQKDANETIHKTETDAQTLKAASWLPGGGSGGGRWEEE